MTLEEQIEQYFDLSNVTCERLSTPTNDIVLVITPSTRYALKIYSISRTRDEVQWELDLTAHLIEYGAPVVKPVLGRDGYVESFIVDDRSRVAALFEWAKGEKPKPDNKTYNLLGKAAAQIHQAADTFTSSFSRERYDANILINHQLQLMKNHLIAADRWQQTVAMGDRLKQVVTDPALDRGICHMDLTLDNVHLDGNTLTVFDFDSAGECWRALEPHGVLRSSAEYFESWLKGYRSVRPFSQADEKAVSAFTVIGNLRVVAWNLGVARSSRGKPLLDSVGLKDVVDEWLRQESAA